MGKTGWVSLITGLGSVLATFLTAMAWPIGAVISLAAVLSAISMVTLVQRLSTKKKADIGFPSGRNERRESRWRFSRLIIGLALLSALMVTETLLIHWTLRSRMLQALQYEVVRNRPDGASEITIYFPLTELREVLLRIPRQGRAAERGGLCMPIGSADLEMIDSQDLENYAVRINNPPPESTYKLICPWRVDLASKSIEVTPKIEKISLSEARTWRVMALLCGGCIWLISLGWLVVKLQS